MRQFGFEAQDRLLEKVKYAGRSKRKKKEEAVATKAVDFTEKWDSDHPTRCCVLGKTPIGKSFGTKLGETTRKVVSKNQVDALNWECTVHPAASRNLHAKCMQHPEIRPMDSEMMTAIASSD